MPRLAGGAGRGGRAGSERRGRGVRHGGGDEEVGVERAGNGVRGEGAVGGRGEGRCGRRWARLFIAEARGLEEGLAWGGGGGGQRGGQAVQGAVAEDAAEGAAAAPGARGRDAHEARHAVLVVVDVEAQRPRQVVFDQFAQPGFVVHEAGGRSDYVVAVREEAGGGGGGGRHHVQDVPDVFGGGEGGPLEG